MHFVRCKQRPTRRERVNESGETLRLLGQWDKLRLLNNILYRVTRNPMTKKKLYQFVVPEVLKLSVLAGIHDNAGHQGHPRTLALVRQCIYWSNMERTICDYVRACSRCVISKTLEPAARAPLESIKMSAPLELVCVNFWSAEHKDMSVDVLVITDHFTKLAPAFPCRDQTAKSVTKKLWDNFFCV